VECESVSLKILKPSIPTLSGRTVAVEPIASDPIYRTAKHSSWSQEILKNAGYRCERCGRTSRETRLIADHIVELKDGGDYSPGNGMALCGSCHTRKTNQAKRLRYGLVSR
jgi:5-methylcytosine-specific restriction protein A